MDSRLLYIKRNIPKDVWILARSDAIKKGITIVQWVYDAITEKLNKT